METEIIEPRENCLGRLKIKLQSFIKLSARKITKKVVNHPKRTICIYFIVLLIAALGIFRLEELKNNDVADLFTPAKSEGHEEQETLNKYFAPSDDSFQIIAVPVSEGYMFNTKAWEELLGMEKKLINLKVDDHVVEDFCGTLMDGSCLHFSPFMYFDWNTETIGSSNKTSTICNHEKNYIPFYYIFGETADVTVENCLDPKNGISKATAFSIYFALSFEKYNETVPHQWIDEAEKILKDFQEESVYWNAYFMSNYGLSNEVERGTLQTMTKLGVSIALVLFMIVLGLHEESWGMAILLGIFALVSVLLACGMGLGFSLLVGLPWTTITPVIIFLALGLGVDNCVLMTILFYRGNKRLPLEKRVTEAAGEAALFNTLSTMTTVLAFLMGVNSSFKGISTFCLSSAIVMTCVFFTALTFYCAVLYLLMKHHEAKEASKPKQKKKRHHHHHHHKEKEDIITKFYRTVVSKLFMSTTTRIIIIVIFAVLLAVAGYEIAHINQGIVPEDAVPEDSFVTAYLNMARKYFQEKVAEMNVVFYDTAVERSTRRSIIDDVIEDMKTVDYVLPSYENPWETFNAFLKENNINPDRASGTRFYYYLLMCIQAHPRIVEHISIDMEHFTIPASKVRFSLSPEAVQNIQEGEKTLKGARDVLQKYHDEYGVYVSMRSYSSMYPYYEMVGIIFRETVTNLITSALAVMIVLFFLLPPGPSFLAIICVLLADVCILGWIPFTGLNLNAISSTCLVMSVGIAVDFMSHITHAFVETDGAFMSGSERAAAAVTRMGRSLTTSAMTTFLSVLMLSVVNVPSNRMFFTMMAGVALFGLLFGLILLPTILSFVNPRFAKPVEVGTPMTPLPPGEEAALLEKSRSRGLRRHHRHNHKTEDEEKPKEGEEKPKEGEEKPKEGEGKPKEEKSKKDTPLEAIDDSDDESFYDCVSDHGSIIEKPEPTESEPEAKPEPKSDSDDSEDLPMEIELVPIKSKKEEKPKETEEKPKKETPKESEEKPIKRSTETSIKKFHRPRDIVNQEEIKEQEQQNEIPKDPIPPEHGGLLDYLWSIWGKKE